MVPESSPKLGKGLGLDAVGGTVAAATTLIVGGVGRCSLHLEAGQQGGIGGVGIEHQWKVC